MTLKGVIAVTLRYFAEFGKHTFQLTHNRRRETTDEFTFAKNSVQFELPV